MNEPNAREAPSPRPDWTKRALYAVTAAVAALLGLLLSMIVTGPQTPNAPGASLGKSLIGGPFVMVDHTGAAVDERLLLGRVNLVYFGFTYCPDFCPTELANLAAAATLLRAEGRDLGLVFVTLDPERDTVSAMADYVSGFEADIRGLTGTPEQVASIAAAYRVVYGKTPLSDDPADYTIDHSTFVYAMDADGAFLTHFTYNTPPAEIAEKLRAAIDAAG